MYKTAELARILGVQAVTIRKYALVLESAGYSVLQNGSGHRQYSEKDATVFSELKALRERSGLSVEKCAEVIVARHLGASASVAVTVKEEEKPDNIQYEERYNDMVRLLERSLEVNERLAESNDKLHKRIEEMERKTLTEMNEIKELLSEEAEDKGLFSRIFSKKKKMS